MKEVLGFLYTDINMLKSVTDIIKDGNLKSAEARAFNAGANFAYNNVLKLIEERLSGKKDGC